MDIAFVFTNFNNSSYTRAAIDSILESDARQVSIVIVDNASFDEDIVNLKILENNHPSLTVIYNKENLGYFKGLNAGINYVRDNIKNVDYLVIGNNDLLFPRDFAATIYANRNIFMRYPLVSPNITTMDGTPQNPHVIYGISRFREFIYDLYHLNYSLAWVIKKIASLTKRFTDRSDERHHDIAQEIYQGYGACYILGPVFFENFDELWAPTFLMYEEFFLSKQLEGKGFKTFYEPTIKVQHHWHASTDNLPGKELWKLCKEAHREYRKYVKVWR